MQIEKWTKWEFTSGNKSSLIWKLRGALFTRKFSEEISFVLHYNFITSVCHCLCNDLIAIFHFKLTVNCYETRVNFV